MLITIFTLLSRNLHYRYSSWRLVNQDYIGKNCELSHPSRKKFMQLFFWWFFFFFWDEKLYAIMCLKVLTSIYFIASLHFDLSDFLVLTLMDVAIFGPGSSGPRPPPPSNFFLKNIIIWMYINFSNFVL